MFMVHICAMVKTWLATGLEPPTRCGRVGFMGSLPIESCHWSNGSGIISDALFRYFLLRSGLPIPTDIYMQIRHSLDASKSLDFDDCGHLWFFLVILQSFVLSRYGMFKATVHQVLGSLRTWSLFEWLGQVVYPWISACACGLSLAVWSLCHKPLARLSCVFAVWAFGLWHLYVQDGWVLLWECSGFIWLNGYGFYFTDVPAHLSHWVRIFMPFQICLIFDADLVTLLYVCVCAMVFHLARGSCAMRLSTATVLWHFPGIRPASCR